MRNRTVFPYFFDPRQGSKSDEVLLLTKLHLLLFDAIAVQDNFLISRLLANTRDSGKSRSPFCDWIERGWVTVALRKGVYSLADLKHQLYKKALKADYIPFEEMEEGVQLYRSRQFNSYVQEIDSCLNVEGSVLPWDSRRLGIRLRNLMKSSASDGSSGLPKSRATEIWLEIDKKALKVGHTRSMYYQFADTLTDPKEAQLVRSWVGSNYLMNLPKALDVDLSVPRNTLKLIGGRDPIQEIAETESVIDQSVVMGRDCVLLSRAFLQALRLTDIEQLRCLDEFKDYINARSTGQPEALQKSLLNYLKALGEEGPRISHPKIKTLEAQLRLKRFLGSAAELLGVVLALVKPLLGAALAIPGFFLKAASGNERRLQQVKKMAETDLQVQRTSVVDFCHDRADDTDTLPTNVSSERPIAAADPKR